MKGISEIIGLLILAAIVVVVAVPGVGASIQSILGGGSVHCSLTPYDTECFCNDNEIKIATSLISRECKARDFIPDTYTLPIETYEEAWAFATEKMNGASCTGDYFTRDLTSGQIRSGTTMIIIECNSAMTEIYGQLVWTIYFDQNGYVYKIWCDENNVDNCPADQPFTPPE